MMKLSNLKIRSLIGLILVYIAYLYQIDWIWGVLFLYWVIPDLISGTTYFMEPITKKDNTILYWVIVISWLWMAFYSLSELIL